MERRIFTYWVDVPGSPGIPDYLKLCVQTWIDNIPGLEIVHINPGNINKWTDTKIDINQFLRTPPMFQSDIASFAVLKNHSGIFMDIDTIVTKDIFSEIEKLDEEKFTTFGYKGTTNAHVAVMMSMKPMNEFVSAAADMVIDRLNAVPNPLPDGYKIGITHFGSDVIGAIGKNKDLRDKMEVLCRTETGNILESCYYRGGDKPGSGDIKFKQYQEFWFLPPAKGVCKSVQKAVERAKFGAVSLHNSWTPGEYKEYSISKIMQCPLMLSQFLRRALK